MTDRIRQLVVTLDRDVREDDLEALTGAIGQLRGVLSVSQGDAVRPEDHLAREVVRGEIRVQLFQAIDEILDGRRPK